MFLPDLRGGAQKQVESFVGELLSQEQYHPVPNSESPLEFNRVIPVCQHRTNADEADALGRNSQPNHLVPLAVRENEDAVGPGQEPEKIPQYEPPQKRFHTRAEVGRDEKARPAPAGEPIRRPAEMFAADPD